MIQQKYFQRKSKFLKTIFFFLNKEYSFIRKQSNLKLAKNKKGAQLQLPGYII